jgi:c-di-GMP-binding flagellar brake protein YcgR
MTAHAGLNLEAEAERRGRRVALSCRVFFFGDHDYEGEGRVLDISTGGCQISAHEMLPVGKVLKLSLFLNDHQWPLRIDEAIVRWAKEGTYGLEFTSIRPAQRTDPRTRHERPILRHGLFTCES